MCTLDERIIEYLEEEGWSTPRIMAKRIRFNASCARVGERCRLLRQVGLISPICEGDDVYGITFDGLEYLEGRIDVENRPAPKFRNMRV